VSDESGQDVYTPAQAREWQEGRGHRDADEVHAHGATVRDEQLSRYLSILETHYDPSTAEKPSQMPGQSKDLRHVRATVAMEGTETFRKAMDSGDMQTIKHFTGDRGQRADISGIKAIDKIRSLMTGPAPMFYEWAEPGTGKTNFAALLGQLWVEEHDEDARVASNVRTLEETDDWTDEDGHERDGWLSSYGELDDWIKQDGDPMHNRQRPKLFIFDEASSSAGGGGKSGFEAKTKMGPLAYKIRKYSGSLIVIGHDGKDVHPLIREMGVAVHKEDLKAATFYEDVQNRDGVNPIMSVSGIPETDWRYDDKEPTAWSWRTGDEEDEDGEPTAKEMAIWTAIRCKEIGMTGGEIAEFIPYSRSWADSRYREYRQKDQHRDVLASIEDLTT
jgi:hypothetical protein